MKKITYFETLREKTKEGKYQFTEYNGWLETFYDTATDKQVNIVFRKDEKLQWKATHLESGILIISGYTTKNACVEKILSILTKVVKVLNYDKSIQKVIEELETYRNEVLTHAINRFNQGA